MHCRECSEAGESAFMAEPLVSRAPCRMPANAGSSHPSASFQPPLRRDVQLQRRDGPYAQADSTGSRQSAGECFATCKWVVPHSTLDNRAAAACTTARFRAGAPVTGCNNAMVLPWQFTTAQAS